MRKDLAWSKRLWVFLGLALFTFPAAAQLKVVASFSILADLVQEVGGEQVEVVTLVGPEQDAHTYQARPSDFARLQQADLVVVNGLGFEGWLERAVRGSGYQGPVVVASAGVSVLAGGHHHHEPNEEGHAHDHDEHQHQHQHQHQHSHELEQAHDHSHVSDKQHQHGHEHGHNHAHEQAHDHGANSGSLDPHAWQDPMRVVQYVENIATALVEQDPANAESYQQRAAVYQDRLRELDFDVAALLQPITESGVRVITPHASFAYLADRYGVQFVALQGANAVGEAKAGELARLIRDLQADPSVVLFTETANVPPVLRQLARETGLELQGRLYSDMLSNKSGPAGNYIGMLRYNAEQLARAAQTSVN